VELHHIHREILLEIKREAGNASEFWINPISPKMEFCDNNGWAQVCLTDSDIVITFFNNFRKMVCISLSNPKAIELAGKTISQYLTD